MDRETDFTFAISLSVLNNLGRNLYRSFTTVLGEAISNSWDANAHNVYIYVDKKANNFFIKDDGDGMTSEDFQGKFLRIGYSKRANGASKSSEGRPFIGRKGIGKLALLSCADKITIVSKTENTEYVGGKIDNSGLDEAIREDLEPSSYRLDPFDLSDFGELIDDHKKGTIIFFEDLKGGIKRSLPFLRKIVALYFRFSLVDPNFQIYLNGERISLEDLGDLADHTQFLWTINGFNDPYIKEMLTELKKSEKSVKMEGNIFGFVASVERPRDLKVFGTDERVGIDLFVNGRIRERNLLNRIPSSRLTENYLYGQIHFDEMDDKEDRFTSSREGIVADDPKFTYLLNEFGKIFTIILEDWDKWRLDIKQEGDVENPRISRTERSSIGLFNSVSSEFTEKGGGVSGSKEIEIEEGDRSEKVNTWISELSEESRVNFPSYAECFIAENLIRKHIEENHVNLSKEAVEEVDTRKSSEEKSKQRGNISIDIRKNGYDLGYLSMDFLANLVDKRDPAKKACLSRDAYEYKPIRDALMHTALLTDDAKRKLEATRANIKGRVKTLMRNGSLNENVDRP